MQFGFSTLITNSLNKDFINIIDFMIMYLILLPSIIIITNIALILACTVKEQLTINLFNIFLFIFISFGLGSFFPIKYYPETYQTIISYFPISSSIIIIQKILETLRSI